MHSRAVCHWWDNCVHAPARVFLSGKMMLPRQPSPKGKSWTFQIISANPCKSVRSGLDQDRTHLPAIPDLLALVYEYSMVPPTYLKTYAFLQLVQKKLAGNPDYAQLFIYLTQLHTYITVTQLVKELVVVYGGPLFPNLRRFQIYGDLDVRPMVPFGLVPGLTSIRLDGMDSFSGDDAFEDIFPQVAEKCKEIKELDITTECAQSGPMFDVFPDLRTLSYTFGAFSEESWSSLARCPNLRELELSSVSLGKVTEDSSGGDLEFSSLKELRVFRMEKQNAIVLLGGTRMPRLQSLRLEEIDFTEEEEKDLSDRLKVRCPDLKRIHFISKP
ncbi:hypothetical protein M407DRAFT_30102 [Tulasnella calospora MUT 4182]|uniref:Uncharacterized protein n=1 Tax=Tulasnella calospora MUT 4182 TaxID=1051891 RepID=A0A0C3PYD3_9AGAM|nr:hypothetical protein M407DRAFT_30102 [Tulasnella calospora MUT 4182]